MNPEVESRHCDNPLCSCPVTIDQTFCSESCRVNSSYQCRCDHAACSGAAALVWQSEASSFYGGRLL